MYSGERAGLVVPARGRERTHLNVKEREEHADEGFDEDRATFLQQSQVR
jgi:hypothetical protein